MRGTAPAAVAWLHVIAGMPRAGGSMVRAAGWPPYPFRPSGGEGRGGLGSTPPFRRSGGGRRVEGAAGVCGVPPRRRELWVQLFAGHRGLGLGSGRTFLSAAGWQWSAVPCCGQWASGRHPAAGVPRPSAEMWGCDCSRVPPWDRVGSGRTPLFAAAVAVFGGAVLWPAGRRAPPVRGVPRSAAAVRGVPDRRAGLGSGGTFLSAAAVRGRGGGVRRCRVVASGRRAPSVRGVPRSAAVVRGGPDRRAGLGSVAAPPSPPQRCVATMAWFGGAVLGSVVCRWVAFRRGGG
jgi:hypothetical protein